MAELEATKDAEIGELQKQMASTNELINVRIP